MDTSDSPRDDYHLWSDRTFAEFDLIHARFCDHTFRRHFHEEYVIGLVENGVEVCCVGRDRRELSAGSLFVIHPGDVHDGRAGTEEGYRYRALYPPAALLRRIASEITDQPTGTPRFENDVIQDPHLADRFRRFQSLTLHSETSRLTKETVLMEFLKDLMGRNAENVTESDPGSSPAEPIKRSREYLHAHYDRDVSLADLAEVADRSRYHLCRIFREQLGLPPYEYLINLRVQAAKRLLREGISPGSVARRVGFYDQSHLTNQFKEIVGVTPGHYREKS